MIVTRAYMILFLVLMAFILTGCSTTVPVVAKFPDAPTRAMQVCPQLEQLPNDAKLSDVARTVTNNYSTYYECAVKNDAWIEWYEIQKRIYEGIK